MCAKDGFSRIVIDSGGSELILCRDSSLKGTDPKKVAKKIFPDLFKKRKPLVRVTDCYEDYSSQFDFAIEKLKHDHDWEEFPFLALRILKRDGKYFCNVEEISIEKC